MRLLLESSAQRNLACASTLLFFALNMDTFMALFRYNPLFFQCLALAGVSIVTLVAGQEPLFDLLRSPLVKWVVAYTLIAFVAAMVGEGDPASRSEGFRYVLSTLAIVVAAAAAFGSRDGANSGLVVLAILLAAWLASASVMIDPVVNFRQRFNVASDSAADMSRLGGVFLQPNIAGAAIPLLLAVAIPRVSPTAALFTSVLAFVATLLTFSRAGLSILSGVIALAMVSGYLPRWRSALIVAVCASAFLVFDGSQLLRERFGISEGSGEARLSRTRDFVSPDAVLGNVRTDVAVAAWNEGQDRPWLGHGLGYSWYWADINGSGAGTHNIYLRHFLEFGVVGLLIWPMFVTALYRSRSVNLSQIWVLGLAAVALGIGFTTHNITEQGVILIPLIGAMCLPTRRSSLRPVMSSTPTRGPKVVSRRTLRQN